MTTDQNQKTQGPTNGERWHSKQPAEIALLDELAAFVRVRDDLEVEVEALRKKWVTANNALGRARDRLVEAERNAARTREAFEVRHGSHAEPVVV